MYIIFFIISIAASMIGAICGIGGGIIIKPVLDAFGVLSVAAINFLSGCTVLSMTLCTVVKSKIKKESTIDFKVSAALAAGAILGGILGKALFQTIWNNVADKNIVGLIQALCLVVVTAGTLVYTVCQKKIQTKKIENIIVTVILGLVLGLMSSFLGIGGGPVNLAVLFYFFSMEIKVAAENSLFIILFSQSANLVSSIVTHTIPGIDGLLLILMIGAGIAGGLIGKAINKKIDSATVGKLFTGLMLFIILVNIYNAVRFSLLCV